ncbi:MAG: exo-alpha-sialidase [Verrucomicrobia bacterium]|nr:exo-alpha-sialidase [Verrucomicrobiota bacterium]
MTLTAAVAAWLGVLSGLPLGAQPAGAQKRDVAPASVRNLRTKLNPAYTIPTVDISGERQRQVIVDREPGQYLGHPTTVLLEDGRTMLIVYPKGHGRGAIVYQRSTDGGLTWSGRLATPASWATSLEVPTLHRVVDAAGRKRIVMFSGLYPIRMAVTEDDGATWSELKPIGDFGGVVTMSTMIELRPGPGHYLAIFHDDGRFIRGGREEKYYFKSPHSDYIGTAAKPWRFFVYTTQSRDGGLTWSTPAPIAMLPDASLCEPCAIRSPDGRQIAVLFRENSRRYNSFVIFSSDEGLSWSEPRELPAALTGDRHAARYSRDGRLFISFRDTTHVSPTKGDWVGWVGTYDDIVQGREGQYRVRILHNTKGSDCAYPGVELLPDDTIVTTTYGHWQSGEMPYIVSVRFRLADLDAKLPSSKAPADSTPSPKKPR